MAFTLFLKQNLKNSEMIVIQHLSPRVGNHYFCRKYKRFEMAAKKYHVGSSCDPASVWLYSMVYIDVNMPNPVPLQQMCPKCRINDNGNDVLDG